MTYAYTDWTSVAITVVIITAIYMWTRKRKNNKGDFRMSYFNTCSNCGANNDPGEICDCRKETITHYEAIGKDRHGSIIISRGATAKEAIENLPEDCMFSRISPVKHIRPLTTLPEGVDSVAVCENNFIQSLHNCAVHR